MVPCPQEIEHLAARVIAHLQAHHLTCGTAESCTGGGVAFALTAISGASAVVKGGIVSYANEVKEQVLQVPHEILQQEGAVSLACAQAMAQGARACLQVDVAVSTTGIAGPTGGTPQKPVGTVCFARASAQGTECSMQHFSGPREEIRAHAIYFALKLFLDALSQ